jgi:hypothetical protein
MQEPAADEVAIDASMLIGHWLIERPAARYPARLEFQAGGCYRAFGDAPGSFVLWKFGTWSCTAGRLTMSTVNDSRIGYAARLGNDGRLELVDPAGLAFAYRRAPAR